MRLFQVTWWRYPLLSCRRMCLIHSFLLIIHIACKTIPTWRAPLSPKKKTMSRVACGREIGFNFEVYPEISGKDRELEPSWVENRRSCSKHWGVGTMAGRSRQQCLRAPEQQWPQMDVEDPEEEIRSSGCRVAARASGRVRDGGESWQEGSDFVHTNVGIGPIALWNRRITQCVRHDAEPHQCCRFLFEKVARAGTD